MSRHGPRRQLDADVAAIVTEAEAVGPALRELRERAGLSGAEVARRLGVSRPRVAALEQQADATVGTLRAYRDALRVRTAHDYPECSRCQSWRDAGASWPRPCAEHYTGEPVR